MTGDEFLAWYAKKAGMTVEQLGDAGFVAVECGPDCGYWACRGWRITSRWALEALESERSRWALESGDSSGDAGVSGAGGVS